MSRFLAAVFVALGISTTASAAFTLSLPSNLSVSAGQTVEVIVSYTDSGSPATSISSAGIGLKISGGLTPIPTFLGTQPVVNADSSYIFYGANLYGTPTYVVDNSSATQSIANLGVNTTSPVTFGTPPSNRPLAKFYVNVGASVQAGTYQIEFLPDPQTYISDPAAETVSLNLVNGSLNVTSNVPEPAVVAQMLALIGTGGPVVLGRRYWLRRKVKAA